MSTPTRTANRARTIERAARSGAAAGRLQGAAVAVAVVVSSSVLLARGALTALPSPDQAFALRLARGTWGELVGVATQRELNSLADFVLLRLWTSVAGDSPASIGMLVVVLHAVAVVALFLVGRRIADGWIGALAATLLAVHATAIEVSARSTGLALATALVVAATASLVRGGGSAVPWLPFLGLAAAAPYAHVFCLPALVAVVVAAAVPGSRVLAHAPPRWVLACLGAAWLPVLVFLAVGRAADSGWVAAGAVQPDVGGRSVGALAGSSSTAVVVATVAAAVVVLLSHLRASALGGSRARSWPGVPLILAWAVAPLAVGLLVGPAVPVLVPEFVVVSAPAVALLVATAVRLVWAPVLRATLAAVAVAVGVAGALTAPDQRTDDWAAVARVLASHSAPGDVVVVEPAYERYALGYAVDRLGPAGTVAAAPAGGGEWRDLPLDAVAVRGVPSAGAAVWLVVRAPLDRAALPGGLRETARHDAGGRLVVRLGG